MAKCLSCNAKKGKRQCFLVDGLICSLCCGNKRAAETCSDCVFYQERKKSYSQVPAYSVSEMHGNRELESYGNAIEGALCAYDTTTGGKLKDRDAIRIVELLMDKYHFQDHQLHQESEIVQGGVNYVENAMQEDLKGVATETIVKILGVIRFVARRRTYIGREYMSIIHQYVGLRVGSGVRIFPQ